MGLDPTDQDYEDGNNCANCADVIFDGETPKFVWASVIGLVSCLGNPDPPPNGVYQLEQLPGFPCRWAATFGIMEVFWRASPGSAAYMSEQAPPWRFFFSATNGANCIDKLDNESFCGDMIGSVCEEGKIIITWGPEKPCGVPA